MDVWETRAPADPYFDRDRNAWIVSRYGDAAQALREPRLVPVSPRANAAAVLFDTAAHAAFRTHALRALAPATIAQLEERYLPLAHLLAARLPAGQPVDLVRQYAQPFSLQVAGIAANVPPDQCERLACLARVVFEAGCEPYDPELGAAAQTATAELARFFQGAPPLHMQMFVALAHTLPAFLGNAWLALLAHQAELRDVPKAIDELLRFTGPAKAQFRQATATVTIGGCAIEPRQLVIIRLDRANRDGEVFPDPGRLQLDGRLRAHLAFGAGAHACVGAALVKSAAAAATRALLERFHLAGTCSAVPADCFAVRHVKSLIVNLQRGPRFVL
jgi:cytochrome P450